MLMIGFLSVQGGGPSVLYERARRTNDERGRDGARTGRRGDRERERGQAGGTHDAFFSLVRDGETLRACSDARE